MNYNNLKRRLTSAVLAGILSTALVGCASASETGNPDVSEPTAVVEVSEPLVTEKPEIVEVKNDMVISEEDIKTRVDELYNKLTSPEAVSLIRQNCSQEDAQKYETVIAYDSFKSSIEHFIISANVDNLRKTNPDLLDKLIAESESFKKSPTLIISFNPIQMYNEANRNIAGGHSISIADLLFDDELKDMVKVIEGELDKLYPELKDYSGVDYYPNSTDVSMIYPPNPDLNEKISKTIEVLNNNIPRLPGGLQYIVYSEVKKQINDNIFYEYLLIDNAKELLSYGPIESVVDLNEVYGEMGADVNAINTTAIPYARIGSEPFEALYKNDEQKSKNISTQIKHGETVDKTKDVYCFLTQKYNNDLFQIKNDGHTLYLQYGYNLRFAALKNIAYMLNGLPLNDNQITLLRDQIQNNPDELLYLCDLAALNGLLEEKHYTSDLYYDDNKNMETLVKYEERIKNILSSGNIDAEAANFTLELQNPESEYSMDKLSSFGKLGFIMVDYYTLLSNCTDPYSINQNYVNYHSVNDLATATFEEISSNTLIEDCVKEVLTTYGIDSQTMQIR